MFNLIWTLFVNNISAYFDIYFIIMETKDYLFNLKIIIIFFSDHYFIGTLKKYIINIFLLNIFPLFVSLLIQSDLNFHDALGNT